MPSFGSPGDQVIVAFGHRHGVVPVQAGGPGRVCRPARLCDANREICRVRAEQQQLETGTLQGQGQARCRMAPWCVLHAEGLSSRRCKGLVSCAGQPWRHCA